MVGGDLGSSLAGSGRGTEPLSLTIKLSVIGIRTWERPQMGSRWARRPQCEDERGRVCTHRRTSAPWKHFQIRIEKPASHPHANLSSARWQTLLCREPRVGAPRAPAGGRHVGRRARPCGAGLAHGCLVCAPGQGRRRHLPCPGQRYGFCVSGVGGGAGDRRRAEGRLRVVRSAGRASVPAAHLPRAG